MKTLKRPEMNAFDVVLALAFVWLVCFVLGVLLSAPPT